MNYLKSIFLCFVIFFVGTLYTQTPNTISWQGILLDANGSPLNGQFNLTVKLYDVATGGEELWTETHNNIQITDGLVNLELGSITALNINFDKQYWLEFIVGQGTPLPRIKLTSVPYSLYSKKSSGVIENDSLVLKDANGVTRMILNPNTGTFKMMNNDTTWFELRVQSPKIEYEKLGENYVVKENIPNGTVSTLYDKNGNMLAKQTETKEWVDGGFRAVENNVTENYVKDPTTNSYFMYQKQEYNRESTVMGAVPRTEEFTKTFNYNSSGQLQSKEEKYQYKSQNPSEPQIEEIKKYDNSGVLTSSDKTTITQNQKQIEKTEFRENGSKKFKITITENETTKTTKIEYFDENDNKTYETTETISKTPAQKKTEVKQGNVGTTITQTPQKVIFSNSGSSNYMEIKEDSYLNKIETKYNINGQDKQIFSTDGYVTNFGPNNQIKMDQFGTTLSGNVKHNGNTTFQGNTSHDGAYHSFSGILTANKAYFWDDVQVGSSQNKKNLSVNGDMVVDDNGYIYEDLGVGGNANISGNLNVNGNFSINGNMNLSNANATFNRVKSNTDISAKGPKKFVIDHPTDNTKLLQHAAVESNKVYNVYMGYVQTGENSLATVTLPNYFPYVNYTGNLGEDINYNLTVYGSNFVQAIVYQLYNPSTNSFVIKTSAPYTVVFWQLYARRFDTYMQNNPFYDVINK